MIDSKIETLLRLYHDGVINQHGKDELLQRLADHYWAIEKFDAEVDFNLFKKTLEEAFDQEILGGLDETNTRTG